MVLITGANGDLGLRLLRSLTVRNCVARAAVRSERAAETVRTFMGRPCDLVVVDYGKTESLARAMEGCDAVVHLVGTIRGTRRNPYSRSHEDVIEALVEAALRSEKPRVILASILGADSESPNGCLASRGRCDDTLLGSGLPGLVLRVPMVLSPGGPTAGALYARASGRAVWLGDGSSVEQPLDARDFVDAATAAIARETPLVGSFDLVGPEDLTYYELVKRAAALLATRPKPIHIPKALALGLAGIATRLLPDPPVTRDMLDLFLHDDRSNPEVACRALEIELRDLDDSLRFALARKASQS